MPGERILVIRQASITFDPRVRREVGALLDAGHEVDVISVRTGREPRRERNGMLTIYRLPSALKGSSGTALAYALRYSVFLVLASLLSGALHVRRRYALVQVHSLPDFLVFAAAIPKALGARVVLDLHEMMTEFFATKFGAAPGSLAWRTVGAIEQASIRFAHFAFTCTNEMREAFVARGADPARLGVVLNASEEDVFDVDRYPPRGSDEGEFVILCHGSVEQRYGIDTAIEAVALLRDEIPGLRLRIMGSGSYVEAARALSESRGVADRVDINGRWEPMPVLLEAIAACDAGLVAMKRDAFRDLTHCNKMYDLVTMRRPVLMSRTRSVQAYFGDESFEYFESDDPHSLSAAVARLYGDPARGAERVRHSAKVLEPYAWPRQREIYRGYITQELIRSRRRDSGERADANEAVAMTAPARSNREHWEGIGAAYGGEWEPPARNRLGELEMDFILAGLRASPGRTALDVGIGSGRILDGLLRDTSKTEFWGVDLAQAMVDATRQRFADEPRVREVRLCDVSREPLPFAQDFDFVSAIRMLKYNENWREMVAKLVRRLSPGGVIVFSMPNARSLNVISRAYDIRTVSVTRADLRALCDRLGLELLDEQGFTKLPHFLYSRARSRRAARVVLALNGAVERLIGGPALAREVFVAARRS